MILPTPRGPLSSHVVSLLRSTYPLSDEAHRPPGATGAELDRAAELALDGCTDVLHDEDVQLALFCLYELHYAGFDEVDDRWEWEPELLRARLRIEKVFEGVLRELVGESDAVESSAARVAEALFVSTSVDTGPGLARFVAKSATVEQLEEFLIQRSIYQLKEADPHTWAVPRLAGRPKAALVEIQADEYGGGDPSRMHSTLFAQTMRGLGLDSRYGHYIEQLPAITLAALNAMSLFGLHRRLRGAVAGHLAAFEMTSSMPNRLYGNGFRRLGFDTATTWYFDEHVEADAVHEQIAARDLAGALAEDEPGLLPDILFGAAVCLALDDAVADRMVSAWKAGETSLRTVTAAPVAAATFAHAS